MSDTEFAAGGASTAGAHAERTGANGRLAGAGRRVKSQAEELFDAAKERAKGIAVEQKDAAASQLGCVARGLRDAAKSMSKESEFAGRYADEAATRLAGLSDELRDADLDELVGRGESYARSNPAVFLGGAVAVGFLLARFFKSSAQRAAPRRGASSGSPPGAA